MQDVIRAAKAGQWQEGEDGVVVTTDAGPVPLLPTEYEVTTVVAGDATDRVVAVLAGGGVVLLDTALDAELLAEGYARDVVRAVQDERKAAGLQVSDRIALTLTVPADAQAAVAAHRDLIAAETLARTVEVHVGDVPAGGVHVAVAVAP